MADPSEEPWTEARGLRLSVLAVVVVGVVALLAFAPLARGVARDLPIAPTSEPSPVTGTDRARTTALREVPAGLPAGTEILTPADVPPFAVDALGPAGADALMALLQPQAADLSETPPGASTLNPVYPYSYPAVDAIIDQAPAAGFASGATPLAAALTLLSAQPGQLEVHGIENAAPIAYAVLDRSRATDGCAGQLDLLLLLTGDEETRADDLNGELIRARGLCPHDPTPDWIVGQFQMRQTGLELSREDTSVYPDTVAEFGLAIATFTRLVTTFPSDTAAVSGLGDAYLRAGTYLAAAQPFSARRYLRSAVTEYNRAAKLGAEREVQPGLARALIGLGRPQPAGKLIAPLANTSSHPGPLLELQIAADESAGDFAGAETVGRKLAALGPASYPNGTAYFPDPNPGYAGGLRDASNALSLGSDRLSPFQDELVGRGGAGGSLQDLSFLPTYRDDPGITGTDTACPSWSWRRDALLAGHATAALQAWPETFNEARPSRADCDLQGDLKSLALARSTQSSAVEPAGGNALDDRWQNLLRWGGQLPVARQFDQRWQSAAGGASAEPGLRLGEVEFLQHQYDAAAETFGADATRARLVLWDDDLSADQAAVGQGAALLAGGRGAQAVTVFRPVVSSALQDYSYVNNHDLDGTVDYASVAYSASELLADRERESGDLHAAVEDYDMALGWASRIEGATGFRPEVVDNNEALAQLALKNYRSAEALERTALAADPMDPIFLMTAAFIAEHQDKIASAVRYNRQALAVDPGAFPVANDLGVELAREGHLGAAASALRLAVGGSPGYALGWFNLGVVESHRGPIHVPSEEGAFARAYALEPALRDRKHVTTIDESVYRTGVDLSKPLPPRWSFAELQRPVPVGAAGLLAVVLLGAGLTRSTGQGGKALAQDWLGLVEERLGRVSWLRRLRNPVWAVLASVAVFLLPFWFHPRGATQVLAYALGLLVLVGVAMLARVEVARTVGVRPHQSSWVPGIVVGLVAGAAGVPWAPLPVVQTDVSSRRVHLAAPLTLSVLSVLLFVEAAWLQVPLTQSLAVGALIMAASTLLPIGPLDGAQMGKAGVAAGAGVVAGAVLVGLGVI